MRLLVVLGLIVGVLYVLFTNSGHARMEQALDIFYGDPYEQPRYIEMRYKVAAAGREFEVVTVGALKQYDSCDMRDKYIQSLMAPRCETCGEPKLSCDIEPRSIYLDMLDGKPARTAYIQVWNRYMPYRRGALVMWGATVEEFRQVCPIVLQAMNTKFDYLEGRCL